MKNTLMAFVVLFSLTSLIACDDGGGGGKKKRNNVNTDYVGGPGYTYPVQAITTYSGNVNINWNNQAEYEQLIEKALQLCSFNPNWIETDCRDISGGARIDLVVQSSTTPNYGGGLSNYQTANMTYTAYSTRSRNFFADIGILNFDFRRLTDTAKYINIRGMNVYQENNGAQSVVEYVRRTPRADYGLEVVFDTIRNQNTVNANLYFNGRNVGSAQLRKLHMVPFYLQYHQYSNGFATSSRTSSFGF